MQTVVPPQVVREELQQILSSREFAGADQLRAFLRFAVETTLAGNPEHLKEAVIGSQVFGRPADYNPKLDPVVRMAAMRLRERLARYYSVDRETAVTIEIPKGGYVPDFILKPPDSVTVETLSDIPASVSTSGVPDSALPDGRSATPRLRYFRRARIAGLALGIVLILLFLVFWRSRRWEQGAAGYLDTRQLTTLNGQAYRPSFSPDGKRVAFDWDGPEGKHRDVWVQEIEEFTPHLLVSGSGRTTSPAWRPDGSNLAVFRELAPDRRAILLVRHDGSNERKIAEVSLETRDNPGLAWSPDGQRLATAERALGSPTLALMMVSPDGSKNLATRPVAGSLGDALPAFSPNGRLLAFRRTLLSGVEDVYILDLSDSSVRRVTHDNRPLSGISWIENGKALLVCSGRAGSFASLWRVSLDGTSFKRLTIASLDVRGLAVSANEDYVAFSHPDLEVNIWALDVREPRNAHRLIASQSLNSGPQFSPDGQRIAFRSTRSGADEVWIYDRASQSTRKLTNMQGPLTGSARWSPDGSRLAFQSRSEGKSRVYLIDASGGPAQMIGEQAGNDVLPSWSRDGRSIYVSSDRSGQWEIWQYSLESRRARQLTQQGGFNAFESPDGASLLYAKRGQPGLWRTPLSGGPEQQVLTDLVPEFWGNWAVTPDGIYYIRRTPGGDEIVLQDGKTGTSQSLYKLPALPVFGDSGLAVSPDGLTVLYSQTDRDSAGIMIGRLAKGR